MALEFQLQKKVGDFLLDVEGKFDGGFTGIFGKSGSGKTTLLHCLAGFLKPQKGEIALNGRQLFSLAQRINLPIEKRNIGMVFQDSLLFPHLNVRQNIFYGIKEKSHKKRFEELLDILDLYRLIDRDCRHLSGGERQRVALARSLVREPILFLMDEPVSSVDVEARGEILGYLKKLQRRLKVPFVYVSHSISEMLFLAENVFVLQNGKNIAYGKALEVLSKKNVWPLVDPTGIENIFELPVKEFQMENNLAVLDADGVMIKVAYYLRQVRPSLRIGIKAKDIIVSKNAVGGISARNILAGRLERIITLGTEIVLQVEILNEVWLVEITRSALEELNLKENDTIYLIIKASSILVLD